MISPGKDGLPEGDGDGGDEGEGDIEDEGEGDIEDERAGVETGASSADAKPFMSLPFTTAR